MSFPKSFDLSMLALFLLTGCSGPTVERPRKEAKPDVPVPIPENREADYLSFAKECVDILNRQDAAALARLVDDEALLTRARMKPEVRKMTQTRLGGDIICKNLLSATGDGVEPFAGEFRLLRVRKDGGEMKALCRIIRDTNSGAKFVYVDLILASNAAGEIKIVDVYLHVFGRRLSDQFDFSRRTPDGALEGSRKLVPLFKARRYEEVIEEFDRLPLSARGDEILLSMLLAAAGHVSAAEYGNAVDAVKRYSPKFAGLPYVELGHHRDQREHAAALKCVTRIEEMIGGDPYLDVVRAEILMDEGRWASAKDAAEKARRADPTLEDAYWVFVHVALHDKNHNETLRALKLIDEKFGGDLEGLDERDEFGEFIKTPQWQEWLKYLQQKRRE